MYFQKIMFTTNVIDITLTTWGILLNELRDCKDKRYWFEPYIIYISTPAA